MAKTLKLGRRVEYRDGSGFKKLAFVTATADTVQAGTDVPVPGENQAHLKVISPTGKEYNRQSVPMGDGPRTFSLI